MYNIKDVTVYLRGAGDLATGAAHALYKAGFKVLMIETNAPSAIRRSVAFSDAVYEGEKTIEGVRVRNAVNFEYAKHLLDENRIALLVDPKMEFLSYSEKPKILIDAIIAKKNLGTSKDMADFVVAMGPGFCAGVDCDVVIETNRGHNLGRIIYEGEAAKNTGVPGVISGYGKERVIHSPADGVIILVNDISDEVKKDDVIANIITSDGSKVPVKASLDGILRGIIREGFQVFKGMKIADIDPRISEKNNCFTISDKSRALGNAVLLSVMEYLYKNFCV